MLTKKDLIQALSKLGDDNLEIIVEVNDCNCILSKKVVISRNDDDEKCIKLYSETTVASGKDDDEDEDDDDDLDEDEDDDDLDID